MNHPAGFRLVDGRVVDVEPWAAMFHPGWAIECLHMMLAAYLCIGFAVAAIHARELLKDGRNLFHRRALAIALVVGGVAAVCQPLSGDASAKLAARTQPAKLAAMEGQFQTERGAPLRIGGLPDEAAGRTRGAIEIPGALSWLAYGDPRATVRGIEEWPRADRPPVAVVHVAFQIMVGSGVALLALAIAAVSRRRRLFESRGLLRAIAILGWLGFVALEAGWTVTEVGRQPWIVYGIVRTADSVTSMPNLIFPFLLFTSLYVFLGVIVLALLRRHVFASPRMRA
jgi:cytochrome d ubiquinol oxidase subunit I